MRSKSKCGATFSSISSDILALAAGAQIGILAQRCARPRRPRPSPACPAPSAPAPAAARPHKRQCNQTAADAAHPRSGSFSLVLVIAVPSLLVDISIGPRGRYFVALPSAALPYRNWPISFSSTTADCVSLMRSPAVEIGGVAAGLQSDVLLAEQPGGEDRRRRVLRELVALVDAHGDLRLIFLLSSAMPSTRPTTTPALFTGARTLRPPMLSNSA